MTSRRSIVGAAGVAALAWPLAGRGQRGSRTFRLGWLDATAGRDQGYQRAFDERLAELGFAEKGNLTIEFRTLAGGAGRLTELAASLAAARCDAILVPAPEAGLVAMKAAAPGVPIVLIANDYDPVATGHIANMARPGGHLTGVSQLQAELPAKRLQVLREMLPLARRVAVLGDENTDGQLKVTQGAASQLGFELVVRTFGQLPYDYAEAFSAFTRGKADALVSLGTGNFVPARRRICELAQQHRLPSIFQNSAWTEAGGMMSYGPNFSATYRRAAEQVAQVFNGTPAGEIPLEQSNVVELTFNLKAARAIGIGIPQSLRLRADRIIE